MKKSTNEIKELLIDKLFKCNTNLLKTDGETYVNDSSDIEYVDSFGYDNNDSIYIFKNGNKSILASSDDDLNLIIGTFSGEYNKNNMPENFKAMMYNYAKEIEDYQNNNIELVTKIENTNETINKITVDPLLPYTFAQSSPYNFELEDALSTSSTYGKKVSVATGCNNTAMAQIIAYWGNIGINGIKYRVGCQGTSKQRTTEVYNGQQYICPKLDSIQEFDYDNILEHYNSYYNENKNIVNPPIKPNDAQKNAISQVMKYVGFLSLSKYSKNVTSTDPENSRKCVQYFNFYAANSFVFFNATDFELKLYNELINKRPVYMSAYTSSGDGHSFNCDGYDAETDTFHINWGWEGRYNGWFKITALNPNNTYAFNEKSKNKIMTSLYPKKFIEDIINGDYNGDGKIDINDVLFLKNLIDTNKTIPEYDKNNDGYVDYKDVKEIINKITINKTYELSLNNNSIFNNYDENYEIYEHNKININKQTNKIEIITTRKLLDNDVSQNVNVVELPLISNIKNSINTFIKYLSPTIQTIYNIYINDKYIEDEDHNAFIYMRNNRERLINKLLMPTDISNMFVDLGLSVKWFSKNIGADDVEDIGDYYAWGEVETKTSYTWSTYRYYIDSSVISLGSSISKNKNYDKAYLLNSSMCLPTKDQWQELIDNCEWTKITKNNKNIWKIKGKNGNIIYLPINGCKSESSTVSYINYGYYWTGNDYESNSLQAYVCRCTDRPDFFIMYKRTGAGIRPVSSKVFRYMVDLGLSVKWANTNLGAEKPEEYGDYYAWGELESKIDYTLENYIYYNLSTSTYTNIGTNIAKTKYDTAYNYNKNWCLPTVQQWEELFQKCTFIQKTINNHNGYEVIGPSGNSIFLPFGSCKFNSSYPNETNDDGYYMTDTCATDSQEKCGKIGKNNLKEIVDIRKRTGICIRPVSAF